MSVVNCREFVVMNVVKKFSTAIGTDDTAPGAVCVFGARFRNTASMASLHCEPVKNGPITYPQAATHARHSRTYERNPNA